ncbi:GntR family transcriptional regulator [Sphingopyxis panaciterrulae]|uniref:DNA-binding GntR family transcriptional regulator n=1 Tax=Sphingopyxis panaciterrulae TaxID=462372 RepID=A0A7W9B411_9SPHN|nr:GntR family transcriptional regulator [Sphingopyxis panaciterrulae]MBB5705894.1 DNA-binding GntR family transcriptional regulator [Sphingopyxis panaciterrulae]
MTKQKQSRVRHQVDRRSLAEEIRDSLRERIVAGEFRDGDALIQELVAEEYGASRIPVREALRQLEACGLVSMETHKGTVVSTIPTEEVEELFEVRAMLECDLLVRAIPAMTDRDVAGSREALDGLEESYRKEDISAWGRLNWAFHRRLYEPARRPRTLAMLQAIHLQTERYIRLHLLMTEGQAGAARDHRELLRLCAHRDIEGARIFLRAHILDTGTSLVAALRAHRAQTAL